jgi:hypothetical protein
MKNLRNAILGVVALVLVTPSLSFGAAATATPLASETPTTTLVNKKVGTSANFIKTFRVEGCTFNPGSVATLDATLATCAIKGLTTDDKVIPIPVSATTDVATAWCAYPIAASVTAADTLKVRLQNLSGITCDMASTEYFFLIFRPNRESD